MAMNELDDVWSAHENQIGPEQVERALAEATDDQVVCRECACLFGQITEQHLQIHEMTLREYEQIHPDASIYPDAPGRQPGRPAGFDHDEETKRKIAESTKNNHNCGVYE